MKKIISVLLFPFWFVSCTAQNDTAETNRDLRTIVEKYYDNHDFIGSVLVAQNGNILLSEGYPATARLHRVVNQTSRNNKNQNIKQQL